MKIVRNIRGKNRKNKINYWFVEKINKTVMSLAKPKKGRQRKSSLIALDMK